MAKRETLILLVVLAYAFSSELEDIEQKKRGAGKGNPLNSIPTGAQKPDYSYNLYSQNPSAQTPSYQTPVQNSFYPSQDNSYYSSNTADTSNPTQSQINVPSQNTQSQFVPINFVPNPGYQAKFQLVPAKSQGNIQLALVPSPYQTPPIVPYPQALFSSNPGQGQNAPIVPIGAPGHYAFNPNIPGLSLGGPFGQPSMILLPQSNPSLYNNLIYPNPSQSFYNYYPSNSQAKYSYSSGLTPPGEYDKAQNVQKEESDVNAQSSEYVAPEASGYKSNYSRRSAFTKYK